MRLTFVVAALLCAAPAFAAPAESVSRVVLPGHTWAKVQSLIGVKS